MLAAALISFVSAAGAGSSGTDQSLGGVEVEPHVRAARKIWSLSVCYGSAESAAGAAVQFFVMDVAKIFVLLVIVIYLMGLLRAIALPRRCGSSCAAGPTGRRAALRSRSVR